MMHLRGAFGVQANKYCGKICEFLSEVEIVFVSNCEG